MLNTKSFLAVDFGAGSLKLAEFETNDAGGLSLKSFAIKPLGLEGSQDATREATILKALQETLAEAQGTGAAPDETRYVDRVRARAAEGKPG